jgi:hypothetical protein
VLADLLRLDILRHGVILAEFGGPGGYTDKGGPLL